MKNHINNEEKDHSKKIIILIIIVILLLLLVTSCSHLSGFLGKIGNPLLDSINNLFRGEDDYPIDDDTDDMETISNKELKFDVDYLEMSLSDNDVKLSYTAKKIKPSKLTCSTSDASIATCYVKDGYVVVNPKAVGKVKVILQTTVNGKIYEATATVNIKDSNRFIELSSTSGILDLSNNNQINISYRLVELDGEVIVTSSNDNIATAIARNGVLYITASKVGRVTITISVIYNDREYTASYNLRIVNNLENNSNSNTNGNYPNNGNNGSNGGNSGANDSENNNPDNNPDINNPDDDKKPGDNNPDINNPDDDKKPDEDDKKYELTSDLKKYTMSFSNGYGERNIVLNTNLFHNAKVEVTKSDDNKKILICTNDKNLCVTVTVDSTLDEGNIKLEYTGELSSPTSLPFKLSATSPGTSIIHVSGGAFGKTIAEFDIEISVGKKYNVVIDANGGIFNEATKLYEFLISEDEEINLSEYDKPYKIEEDKCIYHKFIGYSTSPDGQVQYSGDEVIRKLNHDLTLYAIYETDSSPITDLTLTKTLWAKDIPLFHNEEYFEKYKEDKVIYPGAFGSYTMNFENKSSSKLILSGITLQEDTICVSEGCLNMGYMIKYSTPESPWIDAYGEMGTNQKPEKYWILNTHSNTIKIPDAASSFKTQIAFKNNQKIEMDPGDEMQIVIFWKWIDNDSLDTLIGNYAAKKLVDESINDTYGLSVGVNFETKITSCNN